MLLQMIMFLIQSHF